MSHGLSSQLDPRGLRILKRKLASGEISSQVFKEVIKRQMVKQALKQHAPARRSRWSQVLESARNWFGRPVNDPEPVYEAGPLDMEELFALARLKSKRM
ncbi:MAG: hypothetical protein KC553_14610 [Nitrospina sp.]|nr:hypothetical protein [Nitrospina sp.]